MPRCLFIELRGSTGERGRGHNRFRERPGLTLFFVAGMEVPTRRHNPKIGQVIETVRDDLQPDKGRVQHLFRWTNRGSVLFFLSVTRLRMNRASWRLYKSIEFVLVHTLAYPLTSCQPSW